MKIKIITILFFTLFASSSHALIRCRNIIRIWIHSDSTITIDHEPIALNKVKNYIKQYVSNTENHYDMPEKKTMTIPYFGEYEVSKAVVSIQTDRSVTYWFWIAVNNEIEKAYNELRDELAMIKFGAPYNAISKEKQKAIKMAIPKRISEAEPNYVNKRES